MFSKKNLYAFAVFLCIVFLSAQIGAVEVGPPPPPPPTPSIAITAIQTTYEEGENITIGGTSENLPVIEATLNLTSLQDIITGADGSWTLNLGSSLAQGVYQLVLVSPDGEASAEAGFEVVAPPPPPNSPPDCSGAYTIECLWPPNNKMVPVGIMGVVDPDGDGVDIFITTITSDEPTDTGGKKHTPDASGIGTGTAKLRSERLGYGNGRVYKISFTANDGRAECAGQVEVVVPHDKNDYCSAIDSGQIYDATGIN